MKKYNILFTQSFKEMFITQFNKYTSFSPHYALKLKHQLYDAISVLEFFPYAAPIFKFKENSKYYRKTIDNVISDSYHENNFKFKSKHYKLFLNQYPKAIDSLIKTRQFDDADYYDNLNLYSKTGLELSNEKKRRFLCGTWCKKHCA